MGLWTSNKLSGQAGDAAMPSKLRVARSFRIENGYVMSSLRLHNAKKMRSYCRVQSSGFYANSVISNKAAFR